MINILSSRIQVSNPGPKCLLVITTITDTVCLLYWMFAFSLLLLQRHFCVFAINFPNHDALTSIYTNILAQHLAISHFSGNVQKYASTLISGALLLHTKVTAAFLPTAIKFHYIFNLRDLSNIFQVCIQLTHKAPPVICSRRQFQIFPAF